MSCTCHFAGVAGFWKDLDLVLKDLSYILMRCVQEPDDICMKSWRRMLSISCIRAKCKTLTNLLHNRGKMLTILKGWAS